MTAIERTKTYNIIRYNMLCIPKTKHSLMIVSSSRRRGLVLRCRHCYQEVAYRRREVRRMFTRGLPYRKRYRKS